MPLFTHFDYESVILVTLLWRKSNRPKVSRSKPCATSSTTPHFLLRAKARPQGEEIHRQFVDDLRTAAQYPVQEKSDK